MAEKSFIVLVPGLVLRDVLDQVAPLPGELVGGLATLHTCGASPNGNKSANLVTLKK